MRRFHIRRHDYLGNHPKEKNLEWSGNTNGIAHDDGYWYITTEDTCTRFQSAMTSAGISGIA